MAQPTISCLLADDLVHEADVPAALEDFAQQTYPACALVRGTDCAQALSRATGDLVCTWHGRNHPERLEAQFDGLTSEAAGCALVDCLYHVPIDRAIYWLDWRHGSGPGVAVETLLWWRCAAPPAPDALTRWHAVGGAAQVAAVVASPGLWTKTCRLTDPGGLVRARAAARQYGHNAAVLRRLRAPLVAALRAYQPDFLPVTMRAAEDTPVYAVGP
jgi:hypothetical protein